MLATNLFSTPCHIYYTLIIPTGIKFVISLQSGEGRQASIDINALASTYITLSLAFLFFNHLSFKPSIKTTINNVDRT